MQMSELSIRRPVLATVMSLTVLLIGIVAYQRLSVREYPKIDEPVVTVTTKYQGASAEIVESQVTQPLEESLSGIEGIDVMSSISRSETSQITVRFRITREPDVAANDVRDRVGARARRACRTRSTSRSSPRSRPTPSPSSIWPSPATATRRWT